jgi:hypothetical protein
LRLGRPLLALRDLEIVGNVVSLIGFFVEGGGLECGIEHSPIRIKSYLRVEDSTFLNAIRPFEAVS